MALSQSAATLARSGRNEARLVAAVDGNQLYYGGHAVLPPNAVGRTEATRKDRTPQKPFTGIGRRTAQLAMSFYMARAVW